MMKAAFEFVKMFDVREVTKMLYKGNDTNDIVPSCSKKKSSLMFSPMKKYYHEIIP